MGHDAIGGVLGGLLGTFIGVRETSCSRIGGSLVFLPVLFSPVRHIRAMPEPVAEAGDPTTGG